MNLEDQIRRHYAAHTTGTEPVDVATVVARGKRLRIRTYVGTAFFSIAGLAIAVVAAASLFDGETRLDEKSLVADQSLQQQIDDSWNPIPDPVDPELAAVASEICPFDRRALLGPAETITPAGPPELRVIDQRGVTAIIAHGMKTTTGEVGTSCFAVKVDGEWRNSDSVEAEWPSLSYSSGGVPSEYITEVRLRFPDGTEVTGSVGTNWYALAYPSALLETVTEPNSYVYFDSYVDETLVSSEVYMSIRDIEEMRRVAP